MTSRNISAFELGTYYDLLFSPATGDTKFKTSNEVLIDSFLRKLILEEGFTIEEIIKEINTFSLNGAGVNVSSAIVKESFNKLFTIISDFPPPDGAISTMLMKDFLQPPIVSDSLVKSKFSIIQSKKNTVSPATKNIDNTLLFFNAIPTIELARSVPFINLSLKTSRPSIGKTGKLEALSLTKFLDGNDKINPIGYNSQFGDPLNPYSAGLEIFTSPQTLVNSNFVNDKKGIPVIDIYRPFMSIDSLELETVSAGQALRGYKSGKLSITLHDRSRLSEIAELVKADGYACAELSITYGWSHPDGPINANAYADVINSMKRTEKFRVTQSAFSFSDNGEVKIVITIFALGASECSRICVANSAKFENSQKQLQRLSRAITAYRSGQGLASNEHTKEIRAVKVLDSGEAYGNQLQFQFSNEMQKKIETVISKLENNVKDKDTKINAANVKEITDQLDAIINPKSKTSIDQDVNQEIDAFIREKINRLKFKKDKPFIDPFIDPLNKSDAEQYKLVTLARILAVFFAEPLIECTEGLDEIQFIFYNANLFAGKAADINLGSFLIEMDLFEALYTKEAKARRTPNFTLEEFVSFLCSNFIDDPRSYMYGTRNLYKNRDSKNSAPVLTKEALDKNGTTFNSKMEELMKGTGGTFTTPRIAIQMEALRPSPLNDGSDKLKQDTRTIVKFHIFDTLSSPYYSQKQLYASHIDDKLSNIVSDEKANGDKIEKEVNNIFELAIGEKIIDTVNGKVLVNGEILKKFIKKTMPTITYGTNNTIIKSAGLTTINDKGQVTHNVMAYMKNNTLQTAGSGFGGIPMRVLPTQMDMVIIGCPLIEFGQHFFVDFGTGTTADNIYHIVGVNHTFGPGKFETKIRFVPGDSYGTYETLLSKAQQAVKILTEK